jgi:aspartyl aminopeptidase
MRFRFTIRDLIAKLLGHRSTKVVDLDIALVERVHKVSGGLSMELCGEFLSGIAADNRLSVVDGLERAQARRDVPPPAPQS